jgi:DNA (cytosine-5)-methyltransferase 1
MLESDVRYVTSEALMMAGGFSKGQLDLLKACPPCQGFSSLRGGRSSDDIRNDLVLDTLRFVEELEPRAVLLENVPGLRKDYRFASLIGGLKSLGYAVNDYIIDAVELGVPQRRRRLVVVAVRGEVGPPDLAKFITSADRRPPMTAGAALELLASDQPHSRVDEWRQPTGLVAKRIAAIPVNGNRFDLPEDLQLACHKNMRSKSGATSRSAGGSYGRIRKDRAAPTMTTRCTTPACGSFIHPTENRGITLGEAAAFQTFPSTYSWWGNYGSVERQIGNAVPVWMAESLGRSVSRLLAG